MNLLENLDVLNEIPSIDDVPLHNFTNMQLVRFHGMVQDMYNPEYYFGKYEVKNSQTGASDIRFGAYQDSAKCLPHEEIVLHSDNNVISERQTYIVISVPGLNSWTKRTNTYPSNTKSTLNCDTFSKRSLSENEVSMDSLEPAKKKEKIATNDASTSIDIAGSTGITGATLTKEQVINYPVPIHGGKCCAVKIYNEAAPKLNQILDVIGFISLDPLSDISDFEEMSDSAEINISNRISSPIPRIHAVKIVDSIKYHIENIPLNSGDVHATRKDLHFILSQLLFGDQLAADYLICHLLSSVYTRTNHLCLGAFPMNITNFPINESNIFPKQFYDFLTLFVEKSHFMEITLENLNNLKLVPMKDYEQNKLVSSILQLSDNTHLIMDETSLTSGCVSQNGRQNYNVINDLIMFQKLKYDFKYYTMEHDTDIPILILSEAKSLFLCPMQVALRPDLESTNLFPQVVEAAKQYLKHENRLENIRQYLCTLRHKEFKFDESILNIIQDDFVQMRQNNKKITGENLHSLIVLSRLMSLSYGESTITVEHWKRTIEMEMTRMSRLSR